MPETDILREVADYYEARLAAHGTTARGVDWNGEESQQLRFAQLARLFPLQETFSCLDIGCGYGALYEYLAPRFAVDYTGTDISAEMIAAARQRHGATATFEHTAEPSAAADYAVASGIFNVRQGRSDSEWEHYLHAMLDLLDRAGRKGFAFNCLTAYSDADKMRPHLYYADPCALFDRCKRRYARDVALLHDYGLYEFTILVRKA